VTRLLLATGNAHKVAEVQAILGPDYQVEARDPVTLVGAAATLVAIATIAAALPAYRASRIDPSTVLRESQA